MKSNKELLKELVEEHNQLRNKLDKLHRFISSEDYTMLPERHKHLLIEQLKAMYAYAMTLYERIGVVQSYTEGFADIFEGFFANTESHNEN